MGSTIFRLGLGRLDLDFFYVRCKVFDPRPCRIRARNDTNKCCSHTRCVIEMPAAV